MWLTWPLASRMSIALSDNPDALLNYWALSWNYHILPLNLESFFDANIFAPRPDTLAYSEHLFGIAFLVWPVFIVSGNALLAYNVAILLSFILSGFGMYLLVRDLTGSRWAAICSGTVFLASPYRFLHIIHIQLITLQWFPFVFWCFFHFVRGGQHKYLFGVVIFSLLQALSCNYYAVYLVFSILLLVFVVAVVGRGLLTMSRCFQLAVGGVLVFVVMLPFLLPYERNKDRGFYRRYEDVVAFSASSTDYLRPSAFNKAPHLRLFPKQERSEKALFPGAIAMFCAILGLYRGFLSTSIDPAKRTFWTFFVFLSLSGYVLSLGPETAGGNYLPYRWFYRYLPGFDSLRVPARIYVLFLCGISVLVGFGVRFLAISSRGRERMVGIGVLGLLCFEYQTYSMDRVFRPAPAIPKIYHALAYTEDDGGAVLTLPIHKGEAIMAESRYMYYSTVHWKPLVNGYSGWWPNDYWQLVGRVQHFPTARILRFLRDRVPLRYVVVHYDRLSKIERRRLETEMMRYHKTMPIRFRFENDVVYEIVPDAS